MDARLLLDAGRLEELIRFAHGHVEFMPQELALDGADEVRAVGVPLSESAFRVLDGSQHELIQSLQRALRVDDGLKTRSLPRAQHASFTPEIPVGSRRRVPAHTFVSPPKTDVARGFAPVRPFALQPDDHEAGHLAGSLLTLLESCCLIPLSAQLPQMPLMAEAKTWPERTAQSERGMIANRGTIKNEETWWQVALLNQNGNGHSGACPFTSVE